MSKQANPTIIGGFVLGAVALVIVAILAFSSGAFRQRVALETDFPGSVQGLSVGAQVQFQGVPIGQVTGIGLTYLADRTGFRVPVRYEIWPESVRVQEGSDAGDVRDLLQKLIEAHGLHARLDPVSVVTGQYLVTLTLTHGLPPPAEVRARDGTLQVPALPATRDRLAELVDTVDIEGMVASIQDTLTAIRELIESGAVQNTIADLDNVLILAQTLVGNIDTRVEQLGERADTTLTQASTLLETLNRRADGLAASLTATSDDLGRVARSLDGEIGPLAGAARTTLAEATRTMEGFRTLAADGRTTRAELDRLLAEGTRAARSLRNLTDYLQRHPEALLQGKR